jgi:hypothetical protein
MHTAQLPYPDLQHTIGLKNWVWGKAEPDASSISISTEDYVPKQHLVSSIQDLMKAAFDEGYRSIIFTLSKDGVTASIAQVSHFAKVRNIISLF